MGYIPVLKAISTWKLTSKDVERYAGAIVWITGSYASKKAKTFEKKIIALHQNKIKVLILDSIVPNKHKSLLKVLNIKVKNIGESKQKQKIKIEFNSEYMDYEIDPFILFPNLKFSPKNAKILCKQGSKNKSSITSAITPWGGYALEGTVMTSVNKKNLWIANPFKLIRDSLRLAEIPIPDVTTENGKRVLFVHIDGDGIMNRAEWNPELFSGQVLYDEIFKKYKIPISVSIIEAETASQGIYPKLSPQLEEIAKRIFALDNIEAATHTYTHPFKWNKIINDNLDSKLHLKVKNYEFSLDREIKGSLDYINTELNSKNKTTKMTFWTGDCLPTAKTLKYMYENNFLQINGGDTYITNMNPWLSLIAPLGVKRGDYYQIFTGAQNENVFTNNWLGPFWGFKKVIQTFKLTDFPRRFKPIDIYFHLYSGSKRASLNALHTVFNWAVNEDVIPMYTSQYIPKVMDFYEVSMAKHENSWLIKGTNSLKTLRLPSKQSVDFNTSEGIVGMKQTPSGHYIHLDSTQRQQLHLTSKQKDQNYLIDSNGILKKYTKNKKRITMQFSAHVPILLHYHLADGCSLQASPKAEEQDFSKSVLSLAYKTQKDVNVTILCP